VVDELPEERHAGGHPGVVEVRLAALGVGDERDRVAQVVPGVHRPAGGAQLDELLAHAPGVGGERRQRREEPAEATVVVEP
jgi:hypothetical protein